MLLLIRHCRIGFLLTLQFFFAFSAFAQFQKTYEGDSALKTPLALRALPDGSIQAGVYGGFSGSNQAVFEAFYLLRANLDGSTRWAKKYETNALLTVVSAIEALPNGDFLVFGGYAQDLYLAKVDSLGHFIWQKRYPNLRYVVSDNSNTNPTRDGLTLTPDGGFAAVTTMPPLAGNGLNLLKFDAYGELVWGKTFDAGIDEFANTMCAAASDGGLIAVGFSRDQQCYALNVIRTDSVGDTLWTRQYKNVCNQVIWGLGAYELPDGSINIIAQLYENTGSPADLLAMKISASGVVLSANRVASAAGCAFFPSNFTQTAPTGDGGILVPQTLNCGGALRGVLLKFNAALALDWSRVYQKANQFIFLTTAETVASNGYVIGGSVGNFSDEFNLFLVRADSNGNTGLPDCFAATRNCVFTPLGILVSSGSAFAPINATDSAANVIASNLTLPASDLCLGLPYFIRANNEATLTVAVDQTPTIDVFQNDQYSGPGTIGFDPANLPKIIQGSGYLTYLPNGLVTVHPSTGFVGVIVYSYGLSDGLKISNPGYGVVIFSNQVMVTQVMPTNFTLCDSEADTVTVFISNVLQSNFSLKQAFPSNILVQAYDIRVNSSTTQPTAVVPNTNIVSIPLPSSPDTIRVRFYIRSSCATTSSAASVSKIYLNSVLKTSNTGTIQIASPIFALTLDNQGTMHQSRGDTNVVRTYRICNNGNADATNFSLTVQPETEIEIDSIKFYKDAAFTQLVFTTAIQQTPVVVSDPALANVLMKTKCLYVREIFRVTHCSDNTDAKTTYSLSSACNGDTCALGETQANVSVLAPTTNSIEIKYKSGSPASLCDTAQTGLMTLTVKNKTPNGAVAGSGKITDLQLALINDQFKGFEFGEYDVFLNGVQLNSIISCSTYTSSATPVGDYYFFSFADSIDANKVQQLPGWPLPDADGDGYFDDLESDSLFELTVRFRPSPCNRFCAPVPDSCKGGLIFNGAQVRLNYRNMCGAAKTPAVFNGIEPEINGAGSSFSSMTHDIDLMDFPMGEPAKIYTDYCIKRTFKNYEFMFNSLLSCPRDEIVLSFDLPLGYLIDPSDTIFITNNDTTANYPPNNLPVVLNPDGTVPLGKMALFSSPSADSLSRILDICVKFPLRFACLPPETMPSNGAQDIIGVRLAYACDSVCDGCFLNIDAKTFPIVHHCPGKCPKIVGTIKGSFKATRLTPGWPPQTLPFSLADRNGTPPYNLGSLPPDSVNLSRAYPSDQIKVEVAGGVGKDNIDSTQNVNDYFNDVYDVIAVFKYDGKNLGGGGMPNNRRLFRVISGQFIYRGKGLTDSTVCPIDLVNDVKIVPSPISFEPDFVYYDIRFPRDSLRKAQCLYGNGSCNGQPGLNIGIDMRFEGVFEVVDTTTIPFGTTNLTAFRGSFGGIIFNAQNQDTTKLQVACDDYAIDYALLRPSFYNPPVDSSKTLIVPVSGCDGLDIRYGRYYNAGSNLDEDFSDEFRNFVYWGDSLTFLLPAGFYYGSDTTRPEFSITRDNNAPQPPNNIIFDTIPHPSVSGSAVTFAHPWSLVDVYHSDLPQGPQLRANKIYPNCHLPSTLSNTFYNLKVRHDLGYKAYLSDDNQWKSLTNYADALPWRRIQYSAPELKFITPTDSIFILQDTFSYTFELKNQGEDAKNVWVAVSPSDTNLVKIKKISVLNTSPPCSVTIPDSASSFLFYPRKCLTCQYLGTAEQTLAKDASLKIRVEFETLNCDPNADNRISLLSGWDCELTHCGLNDSSLCIPLQKDIRVVIRQAKLQTETSPTFIDGNAAHQYNVCGLIGLYNAELVNAGDANLFDLSVELTLPPGVAVDTVYATYPNATGGVTQTIPSPFKPDTLFPNFYRWNPMTYFAPNDSAQTFPGFIAGNSAGTNKMAISFWLRATCGYQPVENFNLKIAVTGKDVCHAALTDTIKIERTITLLPAGADDTLAVRNLELARTDYDCGRQLKLTYTAVNTDTVPISGTAGNFVALVAPKEWTLVVDSLTPVDTTVFNSTDSTTTYFWPVLATSGTVAPGDSVNGAISFAVNYASGYAATCETDTLKFRQGRKIKLDCDTTCTVISFSAGFDTLIVNPCPGWGIGTSPQTICLGDSVNLKAVYGANFVWLPGGLTGDSLWVKPTVTTTYTLTAHYCDDSLTVTITVRPLPDLTVHADQDTICPGETITLTVTGAQSFTWTPSVLPVIGSNGAAAHSSPDSTTLYVVVGTDGFGCANTDSILIVVNPLPAVSAVAARSTVCLGEPTKLTASGASSYTWNPPLFTQIGSQGAVAFAFPLETTDYVVTGTDANGCANSDTVTVAVNSLPSVVATANKTAVCAGDSAELTASGAVSYLWLPDSLTDEIIRVSPAATQDYVLIGTDSNGCVNYDTLTLVVNPLPVVDLTASEDTICQGVSTILTVSGGVYYFWLPNLLTGGNTMTVSPNASKTYTVTGIDANGCFSSDSLAIIVHPLPTVVASANQSTVCLGESAKLTASGASSYTWNPPLFTQVGSQGAVAFAFPLETTDYVVTGTDANGCANSDTVTVAVNSLPSVVATANKTAVCAGDSAELTASGAVSYLWLPDSLTDEIIRVSPAATQDYVLMGTDANGCVNYDTLTLVVNPLPVVDLTASEDTICKGVSTTLTVSGGVYYLWHPNILTAGNTMTVSPNATKTYTVTGTDANGCVNTDSLTVVVHPLPFVVVVASPDSVCPGGLAVLKATGALTYLWQPGGMTGDSIALSPATSQTYTVYGTDINGCVNSGHAAVKIRTLPLVTITANRDTVCVGDSVRLKAVGAASYYWAPSGLTGDIITIAIANSQTFTVTGTDVFGCVNTDSIFIFANPLPVITAKTSKDTVCAGTQVVLTATGGITYYWNTLKIKGDTIVITPTTTKTYVVTGTDANGCENVDSVVITVLPLPLIDASASKDTICFSDSTTLYATGAVSYLWQPGGFTGDSLNVSPATTQTYTVFGTGANGCIQKDSLTILVNPLPTVAALVSQDSICSGASTILNAIGSDSYLWQPGNLTGNGLSVTPLTSQTYTVVGTNANGCVNFDSVSVTVHPLPFVTASVAQDTVCIGDSVLLVATGAVTYLWQPDGLTGDSLLVSPKKSITYTVTGTDAFGCVNTATVTVNTVVLPQVTISAAQDTVCPATPVVLTANNATTYLWQPGGFTSATITVAPTVTTVYTVTGTNANGCSNVATQRIYIDSTLIVVTSTASPTPICEGSASVLTAVGASSYVWQPDGLIGDTVTVFPTATTVYTVTGTNSNGCSNTAAVTVTVTTNLIPPISLTQTLNSSPFCLVNSQFQINPANLFSSYPVVGSYTITRGVPPIESAPFNLINTTFTPSSVLPGDIITVTIVPRTQTSPACSRTATFTVPDLPCATTATTGDLIICGDVTASQLLTLLNNTPINGWVENGTIANPNGGGTSLPVIRPQNLTNIPPNPPNRILFSGNLTVDADVAFVGATLLFAPNTGITVVNGKMLFVLKSALDACNPAQGWRGIQTDNGFIAIDAVNGYPALSTNSSISNAQTAVQLGNMATNTTINGARLNLKNTKFRNNGTAVAIFNITNTSAVSPLNMIGCTINDANSGGFYGLNIQLVSGPVDVGTGSNTNNRNIFNNLFIGVYAGYAENLRVNNNAFNNLLTGVGAQSGLIAGTLNVGTNANSNNTFNNVSLSISANGLRFVNALYNTINFTGANNVNTSGIDVRTGNSVFGGYGGSVNLRNNTITGVDTAINLQHHQNCELYVSRNVIANAKMGIRAFNNQSTSITIGGVLNADKNTLSNTFTAISVLNHAGTAASASPVIIRNNVIGSLASTPNWITNIGIDLENNNYSAFTVDKNTVTRAYVGAQAITNNRCSLLIGGTLANDRNIFTNTLRAIDLLDNHGLNTNNLAPISILLNQINSGNLTQDGVRLSLNLNTAIRVEQNQINGLNQTASRFGVWLNNNSFSDISVSDNNPILRFQTGIFVTDVPDIQKLNIIDNHIQFTTVGIRLEGLNNLSTGPFSNRFTVAFNQISIEQPAVVPAGDPVACIYLNGNGGGGGALVSNNILTGSGTGGNRNGIAVANNSQQNVYWCNEMADLTRGFIVNGPNIQNYLIGSRFLNCLEGFVLGQTCTSVSPVGGSMLGNQNFFGIPMDNKWLGNSWNTTGSCSPSLPLSTNSPTNSKIIFRNNSDGNFTQLWVRGNSNSPTQYNPCNSRNFNFPNNPPGQINYVNNSSPINCPPGIINGRLGRLQMQQIATSQMPFSDLITENRRLSRRSLYATLLANPLLRDSLAEFQQFFAIAQTEPIATEVQIENAIAAQDFSLALALTESLQNGCLHETCEKTFNQIYLGAFAEGLNTINGEQKAQLQNIALLCPYVGGTAVMKARSLLTLIDDSVAVYLSDTCSNIRLEDHMRHGKYPEINNYREIKCYPNPTQGSLTLAYKLNENENALWEIFDLHGRLLFSRKLENSQQNQTIDIAFLPKGIYISRVQIDNQTINAFRVVLTQ